MTPATVETAAGIHEEYVAAGFGGFTFNNVALRTPEAFELATELIGKLRGSAVAAAVDTVVKPAPAKRVR